MLDLPGKFAGKFRRKIPGLAESKPGRNRGIQRWMAKRSIQKNVRPEGLKGWQEISRFLGEPASVVQRWAREGMPVRRQGRFITTTAKELDAWLGRETGKPVHVATEDADLTAELKRGLSFVRQKETATKR